MRSTLTHLSNTIFRLHCSYIDGVCGEENFSPNKLSTTPRRRTRELRCSSTHSIALDGGDGSDWRPGRFTVSKENSVSLGSPVGNRDGLLSLLRYEHWFLSCSSHSLDTILTDFPHNFYVAILDMMVFEKIYTFQYEFYVRYVVYGTDAKWNRPFHVRHREQASLRYKGSILNSYKFIMKVRIGKSTSVLFTPWIPALGSRLATIVACVRGSCD